jgi:ParB family chromosome partitioning protein
MWDILNFLKNPSGDDPKDKNIQSAEAKLREINAQIEDAVKNPERERPEPRRKNMPDELEEDLSPDMREPEAHPHKEREQKGARRSEKQTEAVDKIEPEPVPEDVPDSRLQDIPVSSVRPNPFQPRKELGEIEIMELSESIKEFGVLQPILVKRAGEGYELIAGERRLRAATRAGLFEIPAVIVETEPLNQQIMALVENIQRKNLSSIEEAISLNDILAKTGWSQSELSRRMGRSQASVANKLRLLRLDPEVQGLVMSGKLGERQARSLLSLSAEDQRALAQKAVDEELSARALEALAESWNNKPRAPKRKTDTRSEGGPGGELLGDVAALVNRHKGRGMAAQWKVKQMNQSHLVVEITVDLLKGSADSEEAVNLPG